MTTLPQHARHWLLSLLAGTVIAAFLTAGGWSVSAALALGGAVAGLMAVVWQRATLAIADPRLALELLTERLARAAEGDFKPAGRHALGRAAPRQRPAIDHAFTRLRLRVERADRLAFFDPVTNLPNRLHFRRDGEARLAALPQDGQVALLFIDLDRFKAVNDTLGHAHGDMLLMCVARRLTERLAAVHGEPLLGRLAGDEFTALVPDLDRSDALALAQSVLWSLRQPLPVGDRSVTIGASIGVAVGGVGSTLSELMRQADDAMYAAKAAGRGRALLFEPAMANRRIRFERLQAELTAAVAAGDFALVFQPQIALASGDTAAVEALLRWGTSRGAPVAAADFLPVAEECGLIAPIGDWVADRVGERLAVWQAAGFGGRLAVNLSPAQLALPGALARLERAVGGAGARLTGLEVEVGETALLHASADALASFHELQQRGATITIDEFGSGHNRLLSLATLPFDRVKLSGELVRRLPADRDARVIVDAAVRLVHGLGRETVAAGVETAAQLDAVRELGVGAAQGFHLARPMDAGSADGWLYGEASAAVAIRQ